MTGLENSVQGDAVIWLVGVLLLIMSVASWVLILWKSWLLLRASGDVSRSTAAFWQSASLADAGQRLQAFDRESLVLPLIAATRISASTTLAGAGERSQQLTRVLRDAVRLRLSAHSADGLGLVLQAEQLRPAFDEVRPPSPCTSVGPVVPVLVSQSVDIGRSTHCMDARARYLS